MNRRAAIAMSADEVAAFLDEQRVLTCATLDRDGWPHLMPLWYVVLDGECWSWTYAKSQKVRNLERDPRCTVQIEAGESYDELRGVMIKAECELWRDPIGVAGLGEQLAGRFGGGQIDPRHAAKRVAMRFVARKIATWDHRKL